MEQFCEKNSNNNSMKLYTANITFKNERNTTCFKDSLR